MSQFIQLYQNYVGITPKLKLVGVIFLSEFILKNLEKDIHDFYKEFRKYGEWFDVSIEMVLQDWFFSCEFDFIENTCFIVEDEYEYEYFEDVNRNYNFNNSEIFEFIKSKYDIDFNKYNFDVISYSLNHKNPNRLYQLSKTNEENHIGFECVILSFNDERDNFAQRVYRYGKEGDIFYSIKSLKQKYFNKDDIIKAQIVLNNN